VAVAGFAGYIRRLVANGLERILVLETGLADIDRSDEMIK
jgi:hypothetical protein